MKNISRRSFLKTGAVAAAGLTIVPGSVLGKSFGYTAPSDKLNIAGIGVGGMGRRNLANMNTENIVALCDVDWHYADKTFKDYPKAKRFKDWRVMFDEMGKSIDAIMVATPDHTHAGVTAHAITLGKHCYTQKPLTHSVYESRLLTKLAKKYKVATQMGNQGNSFDWCRQIAEWIQSGVIGDVYEVHCWTDRPIWPQGLMKPNDTPKCPKTLDWDLWIGPAQKRPYNPVYTPWNWRGWWDFGTGAFGDMACNVLDPVYQSLKLGYPDRVQGRSTQINTESAPQSEVVEFRFPARDNLPKVALPEVKVYWYDGGMLPQRPDLLPDGVDMMRDGLGGCIFVGTKDTLICDCGGFNSRLLSGRVPQVTPYLRRIPNATGYFDGFHEQDWIRACKESPENRVEGTSNFAYSGPFNEMVLLGVLAIRLQGLNKKLMWDAQNMRFTNISSSDVLKIVTSDDFKVIDGHPYFDTKYAEFNALEAANEYIKHTYREGWSLPEMPV